jgi:exodeoxyribonuclease VII large subunit
MAQKPQSLFDTPEQLTFTVGEFLDVINEMLGARDFSVVGEIIGAKPHPTGFYFSLKDTAGGGILDCYMSPYAHRGLGFPVEDGMQVKVAGAPSIYKPKGRFSFRVETLEVAGEGSLKKAYEALKKQLQEEGLFERKRPMPEFIRSIGLVTSKTGAVIDDFRKNLAPLGIRIYHRDVRVEGALAVGHVAAAIKAFDRGTPAIDALVLIRGGGSMEDLAAFNNELVVRAVFGSRVPTLVSIGHDRDVPLAQMAADASASTPTATAMLVNGTWDRLRHMDRTAQKLEYAFQAQLRGVQADVQAHTHRLGAHLARLANRGRELQQRLTHHLDTVGSELVRIRQRVDGVERHLVAASPERQLRLGYSIVTDDTGAVIRSIGQMRHGQAVTTRLAKGSFTSEVKELSSE